MPTLEVRMDDVRASWTRRDLPVLLCSVGRKEGMSALFAATILTDHYLVLLGHSPAGAGGDYPWGLTLSRSRRCVMPCSSNGVPPRLERWRASWRTRFQHGGGDSKA